MLMCEKYIFTYLLTSYTTPVAASDSPSTAQQSQLGCLFFKFTPPRAFNFDQNLSRKAAQIVLYYHVTK